MLVLCDQVGAGVKGLAEGDWVLPFRAFQGTWRDLAVWKEKDALKVCYGASTMPTGPCADPIVVFVRDSYRQ